MKPIEPGYTFRVNPDGTVDCADPKRPFWKIVQELKATPTAPTHFTQPQPLKAQFDVQQVAANLRSLTGTL